jgi:anti-anti-sigma factor
MKMEIRSEDNGVTKVILAGSMDIKGALEIDAQFKEVSQTADKIIVDMTDVNFLASLGMRTLVTSAKTLGAKGGRIILLSPQAGVEKALKAAGLDAIIPIAPDTAAAANLLR